MGRRRRVSERYLSLCAKPSDSPFSFKPSSTARCFTYARFMFFRYVRLHYYYYWVYDRYVAGTIFFFHFRYRRHKSISRARTSPPREAARYFWPKKKMFSPSRANICRETRTFGDGQTDRPAAVGYMLL